MKIAFLGLGIMGGPMAGHLAKAGHSVTVYNRTAVKAESWVAAHGGTRVKTPALAAKDADFVMACVGNDDDLRAVCLGSDGALGAMKLGAVFVDHTTVSEKVTRELYAIAREREGARLLMHRCRAGKQGLKMEFFRSCVVVIKQPLM
jgi:3-hydroxyisobutyrate dehydrogenase